MESIYKDKRFSHVVNDPRFRRLSKESKKVKIDKRFKSMFEDRRFKLKYSVDKRGRPVNTTTNENLKKYYELSDSSEDEDSSESNSEDAEEKQDSEQKFNDCNVDDENELIPTSDTEKLSKKKKDREKKVLEKDSSSDSISEEESCEDNQPGLHDDCSDSKSESEESGLGSGPDLARGEGNISSSSDEEEEDEEPENDDLVHDWNELDKGAPVAEALSNRLAVCHMDWDRIKAHDLYALMYSFKPATGHVTSVTIYPSEFGLQRMKEEKVAGPRELRGESSSQEMTKHDTEDTEGSSYHRERLRQYQVNRMKYYYAVVVCDSEKTANHIYTECDGLEYESSSSRLDLRFIPDGMTFDQKPHDTCTDMPDSSLYKPPQFYTTALGQSKVDLTWDETDRERVGVLTSKFSKDDIKEDNFKAYLASSSDEDENPYAGLISDEEDEESDSEEDEKTRLEKYKQLVQSLEENTKKSKKDETELKVTWEPGLRETTEDIVKQKQKTKNMTVWEEYLHKKAEKKKKKREEKKIMADSTKKEEPAELVETFSDDEMPVGIDMNDPYFTEERKTDAKTGKKKKKKKNREEVTAEELESKEKEKAELSLMLMEEDGAHHYNLKDLIEEGKKKKKKKKRKQKLEESNPTEDDFKMDVSDQRFAEIYKSNLFNIDPSAPEFKRTKGMESVIEEKMKRMKGGPRSADNVVSKTSAPEECGVKQEDMSGNKIDLVGKKRKKTKIVEEKELKSQRLESDNRSRLEPSLASLVKSVKAKTQQFKDKHKKT